MKFFKSPQQAHSPFKVIKYYYQYGLFIIHRARTRTRARYLPNIYIFIFFIILFNYSIACRICTAPCKICTTSFTSNTILHDLAPFCMILHYFRCKLRTILHDLLQFNTILHYLWCINFFVQFAQILKKFKKFANFWHSFESNAKSVCYNAHIRTAEVSLVVLF